VIPCAVLAVYIHPRTHHHIVNRICWAFCVYLESISVLPQLRVMQNTKVWLRITCAPTNFLLNQCPNKGYCWVVSFNVYMIFTRLFLLIFLSFLLFQIVEPFTAHYVFALGVARFLGCAHWILQVWQCSLQILGYNLVMLLENCMAIVLWTIRVSYPSWHHQLPSDICRRSTLAQH
jgi:hypothetical protein